MRGRNISLDYVDTFSYQFENFFHPFVGELIQKLNQDSLKGLFDSDFHRQLEQAQIDESEVPYSYYKRNPAKNDRIDKIEFHHKNIDLREGGPYANYNWELLFHVPFTIAVHLSKNQRFSEAQRWFHYIFDPTSTDTSVPPPKRFWKFLAFREPRCHITQIDELLTLLSQTSLDSEQKQCLESVMNGLAELERNPFQPHVVARTRQVSYQYAVVMKYLDNLIAWGDSLFRQDTMETINEAMQLYVLASNILGPRPQQVPPKGKVRPKNFWELRREGGRRIDLALAELEAQFPFHFGVPSTRNGNPKANGPTPLFGIGRALYFCIPRNEKLLSYWETVGDRLFKIRHCMNIQGVVRQLALFDPPIDPGMLVKAAAAGVNIHSIVNGLHQPIGPVRALFYVQKSLELCGEVRALGGSLLSAIEKGEGERLALLRQKQEIKIQQMQQDVSFLRWKQAEESTESLLKSRASALERYRYYQNILGLTDGEDNSIPDDVKLDRPELTEENFDKIYQTLVGQYENLVPVHKYVPVNIVGDSSPANQSGEVGEGALFLNQNEYKDLNEDMPDSRTFQDLAHTNDMITSALFYIPNFKIDLSYWGIGGDTAIAGGEMLGNASAIISTGLRMIAENHAHDGSAAVKTAGYQRRAGDWIFQKNLAARELMQIGRQILGSLLSEQVAHHEYLNVQKRIEHSQEVDQFLHEKFTNEELYAWMQGELTRLYYEYYRFAFDAAKKAERTMKYELMRPEVDATDYIKFNYWDGSRKGLLSGEALHLDVKRMELAYHEHNKREYELTKHVSLRQLNPIALLNLRVTGSCEVTVPEWVFDLDAPGHYMRRLKNVSLSIPAVTGPYTSVNCTLSLVRSSLRKSLILKDGKYERQGSEDDRFVDYFGTVQSIVTSSGNNDSGMFETNLQDARFLPFEGAGAISTWKLELPEEFQQFDYQTISDVILHFRYTARQGVEKGRVTEYLKNGLATVSASGLGLLLNIKTDFPTEWHAFSLDGTPNLALTITPDFFPYFTQGKSIKAEEIQLYTIEERKKKSHSLKALVSDLSGKGPFSLSIPPNDVLSSVRAPGSSKPVFLFIKYRLQGE